MRINKIILMVMLAVLAIGLNDSMAVEVDENYLFFQSVYNTSPFGFYSGISIEDPYCLAKEIACGWERPREYANNKEMQGMTWQKRLDKVYLAIPSTVKIIATIDVRSFTRTKKPGDSTALELRNEREYLQFVKKLVERYDGDDLNDAEGLVNPIKYWQIDNELPGVPPSGPGTSLFDKTNREWLGKSVNNYAHILEITAKAIKQADPDAKVVMAGIADMNNDSKKLFVTYYLAVLKQLRAGCIDIFDFHFYGTAAQRWKRLKELYTFYRQGLDTMGFNKAQVIITETGTYTGQPRDIDELAPYQTEKEQAVDLVRRLVYPLALGVKVILWSPGIYDFTGDDSIAKSGLIFSGNNYAGCGAKKLSYYTFRKICRFFNQETIGAAKRISESDIFAYEFDQGKESLIVLWHEGIGKKKYQLRDISAKMVRITELVPMTNSGWQVGDDENLFAQKYCKVNNGSVTIILEDIPVVVEEINEIIAVPEAERDMGWKK